MYDLVFVTPKGKHHEVGCLTCIDVYTRCVWARPIWGKNAKQCATALFAVEVLGADADLLRLGTTVSAFLSLHHYITDGVLWKLRSPDVRRQLFAHLPARA